MGELSLPSTSLPGLIKTGSVGCYQRSRRVFLLVFSLNEPSVIFDEMEGTTVVINLVTGKYFRLNEPSSRFWELLKEPTTYEQMARTCENSDDFAREWPRILSQLQEHQLIRHITSSDPRQTNDPRWTFQSFELEVFSDLEEILRLDPVHEADPEKGWPHARPN